MVTGAFRLIFFVRIQSVVTATLGQPYPERPFEGQLSFFVEVGKGAVNQEGFGQLPSYMSVSGTAASGGEFEAFSIRMQRILERVFKQSKAVDLESLCVVTGQRVWNVRVDIHVLDDDGNVTDAILLGCLGSLLDFRRPDTSVDAESGEVIVHSVNERFPVPLSMHHLPVGITFGLLALDGKVYAIVDPNGTEAAAVNGNIFVAMNRQSEIIHLIKSGGVACESNLLMEEILPLARQKALQLTDLVQSCMSERA